MPNFNVFMHRNNIFRREPDFKKLACDHKELEKFMITNHKNKIKFDFKNADAVRALTCAILHKYFQKTLVLPPDRLIPAVPQRLNYVCWVEDLIKVVERQCPDMNVCGLDIGTGASCIFPILCCHRNPGWSFVGVEPDEVSYNAALENVERNFMQDKIRVVKITTDDQLTDILSIASQPITFIMCNPPFFEQGYGVTTELDADINKGSRPRSEGNSANEIESITSGGEIAFVGYLLEQSINFKEDVIIYSSMLGKKQSLLHFKQTLASLQTTENISWTWAELCQGKTIRYAIAWTFKPGIDLTKAPPLRHGKNKSWKFRLTKKLAKRDCEFELVDNGQYLKNLIFSDLLISKARVTKQTGQIYEILIKTNERNWTKQRRKRRRESASTSKLNANTSTNSDTIIDKRSPSHQTMDTMRSETKNRNKTNINFIDKECSPVYSSNEADDEGEEDETEAEVCSHDNDKEHIGEILNNHDDHECECDDIEGDDNYSNDIDYESETVEMFSLKKRLKTEFADKQNDQGDRVNYGFDITDDIHDYMLCCRVSLSIINHELYFELKLEPPCSAASDGYDLFQYFRNKLREKCSK